MKKNLSPVVAIVAIVVALAITVGIFLKVGAGSRVNLNAPRPKGPPSAPPSPKAGQQGPGSLPWGAPPEKSSGQGVE